LDLSQFIRAFWHKLLRILHPSLQHLSRPHLKLLVHGEYVVLGCLYLLFQRREVGQYALLSLLVSIKLLQLHVQHIFVNNWIENSRKCSFELAEVLNDLMDVSDPRFQVRFVQHPVVLDGVIV
jgi:hypothetical protein